jgi:type I restriction enzyme R subunit
MVNRTSIPVKIKREILVECGHRCAVCGVPLPLEFAHIIPWHKKSEHKAKNLICLCASCHERADKENWDEKTLNEYKQRPWVMR